MPFLPPNQQRQSTEGTKETFYIYNDYSVLYKMSLNIPLRQLYQCYQWLDITPTILLQCLLTVSNYGRPLQMLNRKYGTKTNKTATAKNKIPKKLFIKANTISNKS